MVSHFLSRKNSRLVISTSILSEREVGLASQQRQSRIEPNHFTCKVAVIHLA